MSNCIDLSSASLQVSTAARVKEDEAVVVGGRENQKQSDGGGKEGKRRLGCHGEYREK